MEADISGSPVQNGQNQYIDNSKQTFNYLRNKRSTMVCIMEAWKDLERSNNRETQIEIRFVTEYKMWKDSKPIKYKDWKSLNG